VDLAPSRKRKEKPIEGPLPKTAQIVEFHLPFVARFEAAKFEIDRDQACEPPVVEQQIEVKIPQLRFEGSTRKS
jgi:hypothetical protein